MRVGIYGAYGFSGQLIGKALLAAGIRPLLAGRDASRLAGLKADWAGDLETLAVGPDHPREIDTFLSRIDLLVQTAGPYGLLPAGFVDQLAAWDGAVLDVCGEYLVVEEALRRARSQPPGWPGLRIPACGFESFPALWLAEIILGKGWPATRVRTFYSHTDSRFSPGTRASAQLISGSAKPIYADGKLRPATREERVLHSDLPPGFPGKAALLSPLPEMIMLPLRYGIRDCGSYALVPEAAARLLDTGSGGEAPSRFGASRRPRTLPTAGERARHEFTVMLMAWNREGESRWAKLTGRDPYGTSVWMVRRLVEILNPSENRPSGFRTPEQIFPARLGLRESGEDFGFGLELSQGLSL
jgi:short subunit dehydrogenase-like uncharacterized protein